MRPTRAIVDLAALRHNLGRARRLCPSAKNVAVIKANGYGHGAVAVARALAADADAFAVAFLEEAIALRDAGIETPILILEGLDGAESFAEAAARDFWPMIHRKDQVEKLLQARVENPLTAWVKLDTGMHRLGLNLAEAESAMTRLAESGRLAAPPVLCTHLACADDRHSSMTMDQVEAFRRFASRHPAPVSIANSAGILYWPESHGDWNRPGYMLYGHCPAGGQDAAALGLKPAMRLVSELIAVRQVPAGESVGYGQRWRAQRPSVIGTVPIGYADGYPRHAQDGTPVLVNGHKAPLAGTVSMDMITVDLTDLPSTKVGDPVELWGGALSVNEVAAAAGTIGYQLLAGLTGRVPVCYAEDFLS